MAWLAIAAMAMLAFAPGISQYLVATYVVSSVDALCPEHAGHMQHVHSDRGAPDKQAGEHGDACGYCTLLSHSPVTPTVIRLAAIAALLPAAPPVRIPAIRNDSAVIISAEPRGPPHSSIG